MKSRNALLVACFLLFIAFLAVPLSAQDWGDAMFDRRKIEFGTVARSAETTFTVTIKNPYLEEITVSSLTTSCGCISWQEKLPISIPSRGERDLTIRLDTVRHVGDKRVKAFVTLYERTKGLTANVTIPVEGRIRNDVEVRPSSVAFGAVEPGSGSTQRISIIYTGPLRDWRIVAAEVTSDNLQTRIMEKARGVDGTHYEILVDVKPAAGIGTIRDRLVMKTNEVGSHDVTIPIDGVIEPDIIVADAHFGAVTPGHPKSITIVLRGKKPFQIEQVDHVARLIAQPRESDGAPLVMVAVGRNGIATAATSDFKTEFSRTIAQIQKMTMTFTPSAEAGIFEESFSVMIKGREQPVTFQALGRILDQTVTNVTR